MFCSKEYQREYRKRNPGKVRSWHRKYYQKHKEEIVKYPSRSKEKRKQYREKNLDKNKEVARKSSLNFYYKNKEKILRKQKLRRIERRAAAEVLFGDRCCICREYKRRVIFHEIYGKPRSYSIRVVLRNPEKFVLLCYFCHKTVHWCMRYLNMTWKDIFFKITKYEEVLK